MSEKEDRSRDTRIFRTSWKNVRMKNSRGSNASSWRGEAALRCLWLLRQLIQPNPVTPDLVVQKYRSTYMFV